MTQNIVTRDRFADLKTSTLIHLEQHGCGCYPYANGSLLGTLTEIAKATLIVELGTALGYSAAWFASVDAHVHTIDRDPSHVAQARDNLTGYHLADRVTFHIGEGVDVLATLTGTGADVAFFDGYSPTLAVVEALTAVLRPGGLLIAGNMTLGGQAAQIRTCFTDWQHTDLGETLLAVKPC